MRPFYFSSFLVVYCEYGKNVPKMFSKRGVLVFLAQKSRAMDGWAAASKIASPAESLGRCDEDTCSAPASSHLATLRRRMPKFWVIVVALWSACSRFTHPLRTSRALSSLFFAYFAHPLHRILAG